MDSFEKSYKDLTFPSFTNNLTADATAALNPLKNDAQAAAETSRARLADIDAQLKTLRAERANLRTRTIQDVLDSDPSLGKKIEKELSEGKWETAE